MRQLTKKKKAPKKRPAGKPAAAPIASVTQDSYSTLQHAYDGLNQALFESSLPNVLITLNRKTGSRGYFAPFKFSARREDLVTDDMSIEQAAAATLKHELALNPDYFDDRTDAQITSTIAHEMAHVWQQTYGKPARKGYHDKAWAAKMISIGLQPVAEGGGETGHKVTHTIIPGGAFEIAFAQMRKAGLVIEWQSSPLEKEERKKKAASKTKYTCSECGANAWAKPGAALICGDCNDCDDMTAMQPEETEDA